MSTRNWAICLAWPVAVLFSSLQIFAQVETIQVDDPRPVAEAVRLLEQKTGTAITYEDPEYVHASDMKDVTALVRRDGRSDPRVIIPAGGRLDFSYTLAASGKPQEPTPELVDRLLQEHSSTGGPTFTVQTDSNALHIIPAMVRNKQGEFIPAHPLLDEKIYIPKEERTGFAMLSVICSELARISGHRVYVATVPVNALQTYRAEMGADNEPARDVLGRVLSGFSSPLSWRLLYDPGFGWYALNIHTVPPFHSSQRSGPVAVHPGPPPPPLNLHGRQRRPVP